MGLLDKIFKKQEKEVKEVETQKQAMEPKMPEFRTISDGRLQVIYDNGLKTEKEFYDTTKLTIDTKHPLNFNGHPIYNCVVAWDKIDDCIMLEDKARLRRIEIAGNRDDYKGAWIDLDFEKLQTDPKYCEVLMNELLLKSRVEGLIQNGLQENPDRPCGKYIGGVEKIEGRYAPYFNTSVGKAAHECTFMKNRRAKLREEEKRRREEKIKANKREIERLSAENKSLGEIE